MAVNELIVKLKTKNKNIELINGVHSETSLAELGKLISNATAIPLANLKVLFSYPRELLNFMSLKKVGEIGIKSGDTLFVEEKINDVDVPSQQQAISPNNFAFGTNENTETTEPISDAPQIKKGIFLKKEVPSDNSCLFTSLGFVLSGKVDTSLNLAMRQLVANKINSNPEEYSDAILGKPNSDYCTWILNPNSWGGAIELAVLSDHYGFEIAVVNSMTGVISRFGEDKHYDQRVFLLFDGIHYDPLYMDFMTDDSLPQTMFPTSDEGILLEAQQLAKEAKESKQFTDVNMFVVRCAICNTNLVGQTEAQKHAQQTGHYKFSEINGS